MFKCLNTFWAYLEFGCNCPKNNVLVDDIFPYAKYYFFFSFGVKCDLDTSFHPDSPNHMLDCIQRASTDINCSLNLNLYSAGNLNSSVHYVDVSSLHCLWNINCV